MRIRLFALAALSLLLTTLVTLAGPGTGARAQESTPEAEATPEAAPEEQAEPQVQIVTLVGWYTRDESGDFLVIGPLQTNQNLVAGPPEDPGNALTGAVDFDAEANNDLPRVEIGDSVFDAYVVFEDDPSSAQRWIYFDGDPAARPATLMFQVEATAGPYEGAIGTVTFVSRSEDGSGVIVVVLHLPEE